MYQKNEDDRDYKIVEVEHRTDKKELIKAGVIGAGIALGAVGVIYLLTGRPTVQPTTIGKNVPEKIIDKIIDIGTSRLIGLV